VTCTYRFARDAMRSLGLRTDFRACPIWRLGSSRGHDGGLAGWVRELVCEKDLRDNQCLLSLVRQEFSAPAKARCVMVRRLYISAGGRDIIRTPGES
jgi:hypothetical protein